MNNKNGFISIISVFLFSVIFIMMLFISYEYTSMIELKHKVTNVNSELAEIVAFRLREDDLTHGSLKFNKIAIEENIDTLLKEAFYLDESLNPLSYSPLNSAPEVTITYLDREGDVGVLYDAIDGYSIIPDTSTIIVDISVDPGLFLFKDEWSIRAIDKTEVNFKKSRESLSIFSNPNHNEDIQLRIDNIVNPYRYDLDNFYPLVWEFSPLPLASGGAVSFSAKFKDEMYEPSEVVCTVKISGINEDGTSYLNVFDIQMYSVVNGRNLIVNTHPTPSSALSVYKITNPYTFDIPVSWINLSSLGNDFGKLIAKGASDTYFELPRSTMLISYAHGRLLTNGFSFGDTTIQSPRDYSPIDPHNGDSVDSGSLIASKFIIPYEAPNGSVVRVSIDSSGYDIYGNPLSYTMPERTIGFVEHSLKDILIIK